MKCSQCDNKVTMIGATTCSIKCACDAVGDSYDVVRAKLTAEIELQKFMFSRNPKVKE